MGWIFWSLIMVVGITFYAIFSKNIVKSFTPELLNFFGFLALVFVSLAIVLIKYGRSFVKLHWFPLVTGLFLGVSLLFLVYSILYSHNPGIPIAGFRIEMVLVAILSVFIYKTPLPIHKLLFMLLMIGGVVLITFFPKKKQIKEQLFILKPDEEEDPEDDKSDKSTKTSEKKYLIYLSISIVTATITILMQKHFDNIKGIIPWTANFNMYIGATIIAFVFYFIFKKYKNIKKQFQSLREKKSQYSFPIVIVSFTLWLIGLPLAILPAPNPGFVNAICTLSIPATLFLSLFFIKESGISVLQIFGAIIIVLSAIVISI